MGYLPLVELYSPMYLLVRYRTVTAETEKNVGLHEHEKVHEAVEFYRMFRLQSQKGGY